MNHFKKYSLDRSNSPIDNHYWVGAAISAGASLLNGLFNRNSSSDENSKNVQFQREKLAYDKQLQQQIFQREDTAYQRTADDMRAAGLNPLSMNGTNGAGEAIQTTAPQSDITSGQLNWDSSPLANIANEFYQNRALKEQTKGLELENALKAATFDSNVKAANARNSRDISTWEYMNKYGLTDISTEWEKNLTSIQNLMDSGKYLSMLDTAKKLANDLSPVVEKAFKFSVDKAEKELVASMTNSYSEPSNSFNDIIQEKKGDKAAHAPKPNLSFGQKVWDSWSNPDNFFKQRKKNENIRKNNENYWKNYAKSYSK